MPSEQEMRLHRCCFTGHRQEKLSSSPEEVKQWLSDQIMNAIDDGYVTFITGMAMGVDIWAGEIVTRLRESDPRLHLIAAVPWPGFSARWNTEWKNRYESLLKKADLIKYISKKYDPSIFTTRNLWMADHCSRVIAYYNGEDGGTKDMILYAQEKGIEMKPFDLSHALLDVVLPFESTVYEAGKILEYDIPDGIECNGNEEMIKQLAVILLSNALKYSDEGGQIRISLNARGKQREIRVFNTGNPIAPEDQEKIFDRFWRADPAHGSETGGHGLGLAIARSIVDTHHGKISVESKEGKGTTFTVTLNA